MSALWTFVLSIFEVGRLFLRVEYLKDVRPPCLCRPFFEAGERHPEKYRFEHHEITTSKSEWKSRLYDFSLVFYSFTRLRDVYFVSVFWVTAISFLVTKETHRPYHSWQLLVFCCGFHEICTKSAGFHEICQISPKIRRISWNQECELLGDHQV